jgi:hypothetical protein
MIENTDLLQEIDKMFGDPKEQTKRVILNYLDDRIKGHYGCRGLVSRCESCIVFRQVIAFIEKEV